MKGRSRLALLVVAITAVPAAGVLLTYAQSVASTSRARQFSDWWSRPRGVYHFTGYQLRGWRNVLATRRLRQRLDQSAGDPGALRLELSRATLDQIARDPQAAFGRDYPVDILDGADRHRAEIRVRGDTSVHWTTDKVSFTLRTPREDLWRGYRRLAFSCKSVLQQYVTGTLAREFELLAPWTTVAPVYVDEGFYGLYRVLELVDGAFLLRHGRLPGRLYRGDTAERGEVFKNVPRDLFRNPYLWDLVGGDDLPTADERRPLEQVVRDLHDTSTAGRQRLLAGFDLAEVGRLLALVLVVGDSYHLSDLHNQFWYLDSSDGRLHPVPWDLYIRSLHTPISTFNLLLKGLLREPRVLEHALRYAREQIEERDLAARVERLAQDIEQRFADAFAHDRLRRGAVSDVGRARAATKTVHENIEVLRDWIADARFVCGAGQIAGGWHALDLLSEGLVGCDLRALRWPEGLPSGARVELRLDRTRNGRLDDGDPAVAGELATDATATRFVLREAVPLLAATDVAALPLQPLSLPYRVFVAVRGAEAPAPQPELRDRLSGRDVVAGELQTGKRVYAGAAWHPWDLPIHTPRTIHWRGELRLDADFVVAEGDRLVIEPGTVVELDENVSIVVRGHIRAEGTASAPITFEPRKKKRRWGTLALLGEGASGSVFLHCRFERGGGATVDGIECKGMVTALRVSGVRFERCEFHDHGRCDDALHAGHAELRVHGCAFTEAGGDAIDFELSSGEIVDCRIEESRNDGIDLMASDPLIAGNAIEKSGDKGISVGEASRPLIFDNAVRGNDRGVEVRDAAEAVLVHNSIEQNRVGLGQELVDWRYGEGGSAVVVRTRIDGNELDVDSGGDSRLVLVDSVLHASPFGAEANADLIVACLLADRQIATAAAAPGAVASWTPLAEPALLETEVFRAGFEDRTRGWRPSGLADRLVVRDRDLRLTFSVGRAAMERDVSWDLSDASRRHVVLFDVAMSRCREAEIVAEHATGSVVTRIEPGPSGYRLIAVELEPSHYRRVRLAATPISGEGRVVLRGWRRYALPK